MEGAMADPSESELEILKLFWREGALSVREVQDRAGPALGWAASTTRTVLERMAAKGLLERRSKDGVAVYAPATSKVQVIGALVRKLTRNVLELDSPLPASAFTGSQILSEDELAELEALLNDQDGRD
jgi:BlaI family penicillinase repressor